MDRSPIDNSPLPPNYSWTPGRKNITMPKMRTIPPFRRGAPRGNNNGPSPGTIYRDKVFDGHDWIPYGQPPKLHKPLFKPMPIPIETATNFSWKKDDENPNHYENFWSDFHKKQTGFLQSNQGDKSEVTTPEGYIGPNEAAQIDHVVNQEYNRQHNAYLNAVADYDSSDEDEVPPVPPNRDDISSQYKAQWSLRQFTQDKRIDEFHEFEKQLNAKKLKANPNINNNNNNNIKEGKQEQAVFESRQAQKRELVDTHANNIEKVTNAKMRHTYETQRLLAASESKSQFMFKGRTYPIKFKSVDWNSVDTEITFDPDPNLGRKHDPLFPPQSTMVVRGNTLLFSYGGEGFSGESHEEIMRRRLSLEYFNTVEAFAEKLGLDVDYMIELETDADFLVAHGMLQPEMFGKKLTYHEGIGAFPEDVAAYEKLKTYITKPFKEQPAEVQNLMDDFSETGFGEPPINAAYNPAINTTGVNGWMGEIEVADHWPGLDEMTPQELVIKMWKSNEVDGAASKFAKQFIRTLAFGSEDEEPEIPELKTLVGISVSGRLTFGTETRDWHKVHDDFEDLQYLRNGKKKEKSRSLFGFPQ